MLGDITQAKNVYNVCGRTDMRKGIRGLTALVQQNYQMDPTDSSLFLFCGKSRSQLKALLWEPDGFILLSKQLSNGRKAGIIRTLKRPRKSGKTLVFLDFLAVLW